ncbi:MAG: O-antigen ligase family protein, partial [Acidimicrobiia bacterium]|nr:O-antigen ligase family protein [Acidimicrobiia bacterium]
LLAWVGGPAGRRTVVVPFAAALVVLGLGVTFAVAAGAGPTAPAGDSLGTRILLWREAADLVAAHPATGVGPGRFEQVAPNRDPDLRRTHSAPLQVAAEQGGVGVALLLGLVAWAVAALWTARSDRSVAVGAGVLLAVAWQASWDWVLAEPAVSLSAAFLVGATTSRRRGPGSRG